MAKTQESTALVVNKEVDAELKELGVSAGAFKTLREVLYRDAAVNSVLMVLRYCKARNLDPMKKPCHIVPIWDKDLHGPGKGGNIDTVWPGISELRTTASRTKQYAGKDEPVFGPDVTEEIGGVNMTYPAWCKITVYKKLGQMRNAYTAQVFWKETYARMGRSPEPNAMWKKRVYGQLAKCTEAEALREAFPEQIGSDLSAEEAAGMEYGNLPPPPPSEEIEGSAETVTFELTDVDGASHEYDTADDWATAFLTLTGQLLSNGNANNLAGFLETNEEAIVEVFAALAAGATREELEGARDDLQAAIKAIEEKQGGQPGSEESGDPTDDTGAKLTPEPTSPMGAKGTWKSWLPWFANALEHEVAEADRDGFAASKVDILDTLRGIESKGAQNNWAKLEKVFVRLDVSIPTMEGEYE